MKPPSNAQRIYALLLEQNGEPIDIDVMRSKLLLTRREINNCVNMMQRTKADIYPNIIKTREKVRCVNDYGNAKHNFTFYSRLRFNMSKENCYLTRSKIEGEAAKAAELNSGHYACKYDGVKREIWIKAYKEAQDES